MQTVKGECGQLGGNDRAAAPPPQGSAVPPEKGKEVFQVREPGSNLPSGYTVQTNVPNVPYQCTHIREEL